jgi:hypothetical protein
VGVTADHLRGAGGATAAGVGDVGGGRNRLEGVPLSQIAAEQNTSHAALCNRRKRAEKALTDAIRNGLLAD